MITLSPTYSISGDMFKVQLGLNAHICFSDGAAFRLSPNVRAGLALVDGFSLFGNLLGGKALGYRQGKHFVNYRYDNPLLLYGSVYTPLDAEGGFKIGPFQGLSAKVSIGYAIVKDEPGIIYTVNSLLDGLMSSYNVIDSRGYYLNAEVNYKYRSLVEASASLKYAPRDKELLKPIIITTVTRWVWTALPPWPTSTSRSIPGDRCRSMPVLSTVAVVWHCSTPTTCSRRNFIQVPDIPLQTWMTSSTCMQVPPIASTAQSACGYRPHNLLNRRYDILYGMGAQRIVLHGRCRLHFLEN